MTPEQVLDQFAQQITYGLVPDIDTLISGGVTLLILTAGGRMLYEIFDSMFLAEKRALRQRDALFGEAEMFYSLRESSSKGSFNYEYYNSLYRSKMSQVTEVSLNTGSLLGNVFDHNSEESSTASDFINGSLDADLDSLNSDFQSKAQSFSNSLSREPSLEELFPELAESSPARYADDPGPANYGPLPSEDDYYGPY